MEVPSTLPDLLPGLIKFLQQKKYQASTIKKYVHTWGHLGRYMVQSGHAHYDRDVGEAFIKDWFNDTPYCQLTKFQKAGTLHIRLFLSTYIGHQSIVATSRYVRLTAELFPDLLAKVNAAYQSIFPEIGSDIPTSHHSPQPKDHENH